jgi:hypothetical protein
MARAAFSAGVNGYVVNRMLPANYSPQWKQLCKVWSS